MNTSFFSNLMTRWLSRRTLVSWWGGVVLAAAFGIATAGGKSYSYFVTGNAQAIVAPTPPSTPSIVLMGGGPDVDEAFRWMITRAGIQPGTEAVYQALEAVSS